MAAKSQPSVWWKAISRSVSLRQTVPAPVRGDAPQAVVVEHPPCLVGGDGGRVARHRPDGGKLDGGVADGADLGEGVGQTGSRAGEVAHGVHLDGELRGEGVHAPILAQAARGVKQEQHC